MYQELLSISRIIEMYNLIRKNTKNKSKLFNFELFYSCNIINIYYVLYKKIYKHGKYNIFLIKEPKYRLIMSENISDKIINHLIAKYLLEPIISPKLIEQNVATRKNKGTKEGLKYTKKYINKLKMNHDNIYVLKCDIKKYFYNINHDILLKELKKCIIDENSYKIIENIVLSTNEKYVNENIIKAVNDEIKRVNNLSISNKDKVINELKSIPLYINNKGLPIGNMTSQILAIFYLNEVDHYIKEKLYCKYYIRYMDDIIIFDYDKERLKDIRNKIEEKLKEFKLELNNKTNIYNLNNGFNFLGYYFLLKNKRLIIKINSNTKRRINKKLNKLEKIDVSNLKQVKASYKGYLNNSNIKSISNKLLG